MSETWDSAFLARGAFFSAAGFEARRGKTSAKRLRYLRMAIFIIFYWQAKGNRVGIVSGVSVRIRRYRSNRSINQSINY